MSRVFLVINFILLHLITTSESLTCLTCQQLAQPYDCDTVTECGSHEECYTERQITDDGHVFYNVGCRGKSTCAAGAVLPIGKRNIKLCAQCCDSDLCNIHSQCGSKDVPKTNEQIYCYSCPQGRLTSNDCNSIQLCSEDQFCSITRAVNDFGETRWITGCKQKSICNLQHDCSDHCCKSDLCNQNCNVSIIPTTTTTQVQQSTTQTGIQQSTTQTGIQQSTTGTNITQSTTATNITQSTAHTGIQQSTTHTGIQQSTAHTGIQPSTAQTGIYQSTTHSNTQQSTTHTNVQQSTTHTDIQKSTVDPNTQLQSTTHSTIHQSTTPIHVQHSTHYPFSTSCVDRNLQCQSRAASGECKTNAKYMMTTCPKSCNDLCVDKDSNCRQLASHGKCAKNPKYMLHHCKASCKQCIKNPACCKDFRDICPFWYRAGYCTAPGYWIFMNQYCSKICNHC